MAKGSKQQASSGGSSSSGGGGLWGGYFNIVKSFLGIGLLTQPYGFSLVGNVLAIVTTLIVVFLVRISMVLLLYVDDLLDGRAVGALADRTYPMIVQTALSDARAGSALARSCDWGKALYWVTLATVVIGQFGTCVGYLTFVGSNLHQLSPEVLSFQAGVMVAASIIFPMALIQRMKALSPVSMLGMTALLTGFIGFGIFCGQKSTGSVSPAGPGAADTVDRWGEVKWDGLFRFTGIALFASEGILALPSVKISLRSRHKDKTTAAVSWLMDLALATMTVFLLIAGIIGWRCLGAHPSSVITQSLPTSGYDVASMIRVALSVYIMCTYPLQLFPAIEAIEDLIKRAPTGNGTGNGTGGGGGGRRLLTPSAGHGGDHDDGDSVAGSDAGMLTDGSAAEDGGDEGAPLAKSSGTGMGGGAVLAGGSLSSSAQPAASGSSGSSAVHDAAADEAGGRALLAASLPTASASTGGDDAALLLVQSPAVAVAGTVSRNRSAGAAAAGGSGLSASAKAGAAFKQQSGSSSGSGVVASHKLSGRPKLRLEKQKGCCGGCCKSRSSRNNARRAGAGSGGGDGDGGDSDSSEDDGGDDDDDDMCDHCCSALGRNPVWRYFCMRPSSQQEDIIGGQRGEGLSFLVSTVMRVLVVVATAGVAAQLTHFGVFISFMGWLCFGVLSFIMPPAMYLVLVPSLFGHKMGALDRGEHWTAWRDRLRGDERKSIPLMVAIEQPRSAGFEDDDAAGVVVTPGAPAADVLAAGAGSASGERGVTPASQPVTSSRKVLNRASAAASASAAATREWFRTSAAPALYGDASASDSQKTRLPWYKSVWRWEQIGLYTYVIGGTLMTIAGCVMVVMEAVADDTSSDKVAGHNHHS